MAVKKTKINDSKIDTIKWIIAAVVIPIVIALIYNWKTFFPEEKQMPETNQYQNNGGGINLGKRK